MNYKHVYSLGRSKLGIASLLRQIFLRGAVQEVGKLGRLFDAQFLTIETLSP